MNWFQRIFAKPKVSTARNFGRIEFDSEAVRFYLPQGEVQHIQWNGLDEVRIMTTDEGPFAEDVFFMLYCEDEKVCKIPQSAEGTEELLARLQMLPNFNNENLIEALGSTSNQQFKLWMKTAEQDAPSDGDNVLV
jgi:hypothetical protein